jgi:N-acetylglucosamine kinase
MRATNETLNFINYINIKAICLGLAGVGRATDIEIIKALVEDLQNSKLLRITWASASNIVICNDALIALVGGNW